MLFNQWFLELDDRDLVDGDRLRAAWEKLEDLGVDGDEIAVVLELALDAVLGDESE